MGKNIRFIHSADLHLDSPYKGLKGLPDRIFQDIKTSTMTAFNRLIDLAIDLNVDLLLIVGDLFDQESTSIKSSLQLKKGLERLNQQGIKVYISYGNHDYMMQDKVNLTFPENTYVFPSHEVTNAVFEKDGERVAEISGFSYYSQSVKERMVENYRKTSDAPYHIATLHGSLQGQDEHAVYAPFSLGDLKKVDANYWALGHIHKREWIMDEPYAVYPGNIQGRHMKETGEKGCYLVELSDHQTDLNFYSLQEVVFTEEEIALDNVHLIDDLIEKLQSVKKTLRQEHQKYVVRMQVHLNEASELTLDSEQIEDVLSVLNEEEEDEPYWIWFSELNVQEPQIISEDLSKTNLFVSEVLQTIKQTEDLDDYLEDLLKHKIFRRHTAFDQERFQEEVKQEAEQMILHELLRNG
ncbi:metallophosphoesterase family protein [Aquisalibacillus elongatus]|uniref:DNA repair exonuclease SbcCD nuclease subunit n=1 Tax=Aquisalibacillus elongatus TaxID=485577 RepID=A0A3N5AY19_9BACI|nr:DNA repair exonuclease [Aquisalibacillus elongatus]RPF50156.1 DNA repair exonuclease SbcCD nuclease subunit [Aquisalibacillus elongatus]